MIELFESHCHADHPLIESKYMYIEDARRIGVKHFVIAPITYESNYSSMDWYPPEDYPDVMFAKGLHPKYAYNEMLWDEKKIEEFRNLLKSDNRIVAIKSGIDLSQKNLQLTQIERQFEFLQLFMDLAEEYGLPLVLHIRDAAEETLQYLKDHPLQVRTEVHCFNYDIETMEKFIDAGIRFFGIGGKVTLDDSVKLKEAVSKMDLSMLLLESDAPFVKVKGEVGKINTSDRALPTVAEKIAEIKGISVEAVIRASYENACRFFGIN